MITTSLTTTQEMERPTQSFLKRRPVKEERQQKEPHLNRTCRSAICGGDPFIPDSEYLGGSCELTCDVKENEVSKHTD